MNYQPIIYAFVFRIKFAPEYQITKSGECFNLKSGKKVRQVINSRCIGYNIRGRFYSLKYLRKQLVRND